MKMHGDNGKRVGSYLRVLTSEQTTNNQRRELVAVAGRHGWTVVRVFEDAGISGAKGRGARGRPRRLDEGGRTTGDRHGCRVVS